jgi:putative Mg2+ transporter-C (MgtC) family protein
MEYFLSGNPDIVIGRVWAMLLGGLIGVERLFAGKTAGMRTYSLVSLGSAVFVLVGIIVTENGTALFDPMRMASQIIVGVGFLGAGLIIFRGNKVSGLTTAAGLWLAAAVGMSVGFGLFDLAIITTFLTLFIFIALGYVKKKLERLSPLRSFEAEDADDKGEVI